MQMSLKHRVKRIENKTSPPKYAQMEDILFLIHFGKEKNISFSDQRRLEEIKDLPLHPELEKAFREIEDSRKAQEESDNI